VFASWPVPDSPEPTATLGNGIDPSGLRLPASVAYAPGGAFLFITLNIDGTIVCPDGDQERTADAGGDLRALFALLDRIDAFLAGHR